MSIYLYVQVIGVHDTQQAGTGSTLYGINLILFLISQVHKEFIIMTLFLYKNTWLNLWSVHFSDGKLKSIKT